MVLRIKYFVLALLSAALLPSCVKEWQGPDAPSGYEERITSVVHYRAAVGEGRQTKSSLNNLNQYIFETGDQLYVQSGTDLYGVLNLVAGAGDTHATFEGELMCLNDFEPSDGTSLSATLVSRDDKIHNCADGKITGTAYPNSGADAYAGSFAEAVRCFSDFTAVNTFGAHAFSLEQQSTFLNFTITFSDAESTAINGAGTVTATISNNGSPLRTGPVDVAEVDYSDQVNFVAAFSASTALSGASVSFATAGGTPVGSADGITDATLLANRYYEVSRSHVDLDCFTIQAREANTTVTFNYTGTGTQYQLSTGGGWTDYDAVAGILLAKEKDYVLFRSKRTTFNTNGTPVFSADKPVFIYGDIMSLMCDASYNKKTTLGSKAFQYAFKNSTWIDIPAGRPLILSAETLASNCYDQMFQGCTSLTRPPELQTTLTANIPNYAYAAMFQGCTALVSAPDLPSGRTVGDYGYKAMFSGCTSLTTVPATIEGTIGIQSCREMFYNCTSLANAPALPSASVGQQGYYQMFKGCTSLVQAPELPAVSLAVSCYQEMFMGCTALVSAPPELSATGLFSSCYYDMFNGCLALTNAMAVLPATASAESCYREMFQNCISLNLAPEIRLQDIGASSCRAMFNGCTSLVTATGLENAESVGSYGCYFMFRNCGELITTPSVLKATTLSESAYDQMYYGCAKITAAPDIQATSVASKSCFQMFYGCRRLRTAPPRLAVAVVEQQAFKEMFRGCASLASAPDFTGMTTVGEEGCMDMFNGCSNLTVPPALPATGLGKSAYQGMFKGSAVSSAPELPAVTLAQQCYQSMFEGCKYLEGPVMLFAPTLVTECYKNMFTGASLLNSVVCLATSGISTANCADWLKNVSATGTFMRPAGVDSWTLDSGSGIPTGWVAYDTGIDPIFPGGGPFDPEEEI